MKRSAIFFSGLFLYFMGCAFAQTNTCTCCTENHRAFDFWLGQWRVTNSSGAVVGTNRITKLQGDCAIREEWEGTSGTTGTSINFFNAQTGLWEQLWVDNQGTQLKLKGNREKNRMILASETFTHTDGKHYQNRITWTRNSDGTVRQLWELVAEDSTVRVLFDGLYTREE